MSDEHWYSGLSDGLNKAGGFLKKELGFDEEGSTQYTTDYNYLKYIPPPCEYYNNKKPGYCCSIEEREKNPNDCTECSGDAVDKRLCNYIIDDIPNQSWDDTKVIGWFDKLMRTTNSISNYKDIVLPGDKDAIDLRLGSRYFTENGIKCLDEKGNKLIANNYINSIPMPPGNTDLGNSMLNTFELFNIDKIIYNSGSVDKLGKTPKCKMLTMPVGIWVNGETDGCPDNSFIKNDKCYYETKPIIVGSSIIDPPGLSKAETPINRFKKSNISHEKPCSATENYTNYDNDNLKCKKCDSRLILLFIILFIILLLLNFFIF